jgi:hypothetical protein
MYIYFTLDSRENRIEDVTGKHILNLPSDIKKV